MWKVLNLQDYSGPCKSPIFHNGKSFDIRSLSMGSANTEGVVYCFILKPCSCCLRGKINW